MGIHGSDMLGLVGLTVTLVLSCVVLQYVAIVNADAVTPALCTLSMTSTNESATVRVSGTSGSGGKLLVLDAGEKGTIWFNSSIDGVAVKSLIDSRVKTILEAQQPGNLTLQLAAKVEQLSQQIRNLETDNASLRATVETLSAIVLAPPISCKDILKSRSRAPSGVYQIVPVGGSAVNVYCDMDADGGGWTALIHPSVAGLPTTAPGVDPAQPGLSKILALNATWSATGTCPNCYGGAAYDTVNIARDRNESMLWSYLCGGTSCKVTGTFSWKNTLFAMEARFVAQVNGDNTALTMNGQSMAYVASPDGKVKTFSGNSVTCDSNRCGAGTWMFLQATPGTMRFSGDLLITVVGVSDGYSWGGSVMLSRLFVR
eukprot:Opistho-2@90581